MNKLRTMYKSIRHKIFSGLERVIENRAIKQTEEVLKHLNIDITTVEDYDYQVLVSAESQRYRSIFVILLILLSFYSLVVSLLVLDAKEESLLTLFYAFTGFLLIIILKITVNFSKSTIFVEKFVKFKNSDNPEEQREFTTLSKYIYGHKIMLRTSDVILIKYMNQTNY